MTHCYIDRYVTKTCAKTLKILRSITKWWDWFVHWVIKMAWIYCNFLPSWLLLLHTELCMECTITHPHWYMTSVRYRGQILICGFDVMISLAQSSRSGITITNLLQKFLLQHYSCVSFRYANLVDKLRECFSPRLWQVYNLRKPYLINISIRWKIQFSCSMYTLMGTRYFFDEYKIRVSQPFLVHKMK